MNPYRGEPPRSPRSQEAQKKASLNRVKLRVNVNASSLIFLYKIDSHGGIMTTLEASQRPIRRKKRGFAVCR